MKVINHKTLLGLLKMLEDKDESLKGMSFMIKKENDEIPGRIYYLTNEITSSEKYSKYSNASKLVLEKMSENEQMIIESLLNMDHELYLISSVLLEDKNDPEMKGIKIPNIEFYPLDSMDVSLIMHKMFGDTVQIATIKTKEITDHLEEIIREETLYTI